MLDIPGVGAGGRRRPRPEPRRACTPTPDGRRAPCSRTCRATSCSSSSRRRWRGSWRRSSGSRSASSCGRSRCPSRSGRGSRCSCTCPATGSRPSCPSGSPTPSPTPTRPTGGTFETDVGASSLARIAVSVRCAGPARVASTSTRSSGSIDELSTSWSDRLRRGARRRRRRGARRASCSTPSAPTRRPAYVAAVAPGAGDRRRPPHRRAARAGDAELTTVARPRRRRPGRRVALPRVPARHAGRAVRAAAAARPPRPAGARRAAVHVPPRRPTGCTSTTSASASGRRRARRASGAPRCQEAFTALVDGSSRERRLQPPRAARRPQRPRGRASCGPTASTCARSASPFSQPYIEDTLAAHPRLVADLVALFHARFDPAASAAPPATSGLQSPTPCAVRIVDALDAIPSLDDDRICRAFLTLIDADGAHELLPSAGRRSRSSSTRRRSPSCRCRGRSHEIWVCGPRVEGVHLRGGDIARGGLRWSDRREDFRTEVLGLMKAQMVKNAVIVPTGAKGGFVVKRPPADPEELRAEVVECYRAFIRGLLDLTDNLVSSPASHGVPATVVHPPDTVVHDGDDTYLVVAADKGTATFSDIANEIAARVRLLARRRVRVRWQRRLRPQGDGHHRPRRVGERAPPRQRARQGRRPRSADGGRHRRHVGRRVRQRDAAVARSCGSSPRSTTATSSSTPTPTRRVAFAERQRLFELPRSSWADYDPALHLAGRRRLPAHAEVDRAQPARRGAVLGAPDGPLTPNELVSAILRAPVDLLWNGGIGTYVKARTRVPRRRRRPGQRRRAGERRRAALPDGRRGRQPRVHPARARRVRARAAGSSTPTPSTTRPGVDCSDHEVNIKILLDGIVDAGELTTKQRNEVLAVDDRRGRRPRARQQRGPDAGADDRPPPGAADGQRPRPLHRRAGVRGLARPRARVPADRQADRRAPGRRRRPAGARVRRAHRLHEERQRRRGRPDATCPTSRLLEADLVAYFPSALRERYADAIRQHPLRREIIATRLVNQMVNLSGISLRPPDDGGHRRLGRRRDAGVGRRPRGARLRRACGRRSTRSASEVPLDVQLELFLDCRRMAERAALWLLRHRRPPIDIAAAVAQFQPGLGELAAVARAGARRAGWPTSCAPSRRRG